mmetsp:Transcript_47331/g.137879  ORF Transcript_47331/g.137879 Transcript_47331/m.137879 type:complete len:334 (+) Transcript_47331:824-1825(+)
MRRQRRRKGCCRGGARNIDSARRSSRWRHSCSGGWDLCIDGWLCGNRIDHGPRSPDSVANPRCVPQALIQDWAKIAQRRGDAHIERSVREKKRKVVRAMTCDGCPVVVDIPRDLGRLIEPWPQPPWALRRWRHCVGRALHDRHLVGGACKCSRANRASHTSRCIQRRRRTGHRRPIEHARHSGFRPSFDVRGCLPRLRRLEGERTSQRRAEMVKHAWRQALVAHRPKPVCDESPRHHAGEEGPRAGCAGKWTPGAAGQIAPLQAVVAAAGAEEEVKRRGRGFKPRSRRAGGRLAQCLERRDILGAQNAEGLLMNCAEGGNGLRRRCQGDAVGR